MELSQRPEARACVLGGTVLRLQAELAGGESPALGSKWPEVRDEGSAQGLSERRDSGREKGETAPRRGVIRKYREKKQSVETPEPRRGGSVQDNAGRVGAL